MSQYPPWQKLTEYYSSGAPRPPYVPSDPPTPPAGAGIYIANPVWCFTDIAKTTHAGLGDKVAAWEDKQGALPDIIQTDAAKRPTLTLEGGRHALDFGIAVELKTLHLAKTFGPKAEFILVARDGMPSAKYINGEGTDHTPLGMNGDHTWYHKWDSWVPGSGCDAHPHILTSIVDTQAVLRMDGRIVANGTSAPTQAPSLIVGISDDTTYPNPNGNVSFLEVIDGSLFTDEHRHATEAWLSNEYGIPILKPPTVVFPPPPSGCGVYVIEPSNCYTDIAKTTHAAVGQKVAAVEDDTGTFPDLAQPDPAHQLTLEQDSDGYYLSKPTDTWMTIPGIHLPHPSDFIMVLDVKAAAEQGAVFGVESSKHEFLFHRSTQLRLLWKSGALNTKGAIVEGEPHIFSPRIDGAHSQIRVDGVTKREASSGDSEGTGFIYGGMGTPVTFTGFESKLRFLQIYPDGLFSNEYREHVERWLGVKYDVPVEHVFDPSLIAPPTTGIWIADPLWCYADLAKTTRCGLGDRIAVWVDSTGHLPDLTQPIEAYRPVLDGKHPRMCAVFGGETDGSTKNFMDFQHHELPYGNAGIYAQYSRPWEAGHPVALMSWGKDGGAEGEASYFTRMAHATFHDMMLYYFKNAPGIGTGGHVDSMLDPHAYVTESMEGARRDSQFYFDGTMAASNFSVPPVHDTYGDTVRLGGVLAGVLSAPSPGGNWFHGRVWTFAFNVAPTHDWSAWYRDNYMRWAEDRYKPEDEPAHHAGIGIFQAGPDWCFTDIAKTTKAGIGDHVAAWVDSEGVLGDFTQPDAQKRPMLMNDGKGYYLKPDGANDHMDSPVVMQHPGDILLVGGIGSGEMPLSGIGDPNVFVQGNPSGAGKTRVEWAGTQLDAPDWNALDHVYTVRLDGASSFLNVDGTEKATGGLGTGNATMRIFAGGNLTHYSSDPMRCLVLNPTGVAFEHSYLGALERWLIEKYL